MIKLDLEKVTDMVSLKEKLRSIILKINEIVDYFNGKGNGSYKVYVATMTQSGVNNPPVPTVLRNTIGGDIVWTYSSAGDYIGTLTGAFTVGKVWTNFSPMHVVALDSYAVKLLTVDTISLQSGLLADALHDDILLNSPIEIRVYY